MIEISSSVKSIGDFAFFSASSQVEKIVLHHNSEADMELGRDWQPNHSDKINKKIPIEFVGE